MMTIRRWGMLGVLLLSGCSKQPTSRAGTAAPSGGAAPFRAVCVDSWSVRPLWEGRRPDFAFPLDAVSATRMGSTYLVAANTRRPFDDRPMGDRVALATLDGRALELPPGAQNGFSPMVAAIGDTTYLVWAETVPEAPSASGFLTWPPRVAAVWFAWRAPGGRWSAAREVVRAPEVNWGYQDATLLPAGSAALELFFSAGMPGDDKLVVARFAGGGVSIHERKVSTGAFHTQASQRSDTTFVAFVGTDTVPTLVRSGFATDQNTLFLTTWHSPTQSWGRVRLVQQGKDQGAVYPRLVVTRDGALHGVWTQLGARVLRHASSRDGGVTWSSPSDLALPGAYAKAAFAVGDSGVALLYDEIDERGAPRLGVACWNQGWVGHRLIGGEDRLASPSLLDPKGIEVIAMRMLAGNPPRFENVIIAPALH